MPSIGLRPHLPPWTVLLPQPRRPRRPVAIAMWLGWRPVSQGTVLFRSGDGGTAAQLPISNSSKATAAVRGHLLPFVQSSSVVLLSTVPSRVEAARSAFGAIQDAMVSAVRRPRRGSAPRIVVAAASPPTGVPRLAPPAKPFTSTVERMLIFEEPKFEQNLGLLKCTVGSVAAA
ncbi:hypothetical protein U9M48_042518 [Paspalum notatum var. saurae]|uniref:Uncharacterized protein n=1 Tax=Paspalum notatum var. saurae TaxID=547442 RepID=A0AAQ3UX91_PASNO